MKNSHFNLLKVANKLRTKYALDGSTIKDEIQNIIQTALSNASDNPVSGIMPFIKMLEQDQASLAINVTRNGNNVIVSNPALTPSNVSAKYAALPGQIKKYLERYPELYPSQRNGEHVDYNNLTVTLTFTDTNDKTV